MVLTVYFVSHPYEHVQARHPETRKLAITQRIFKPLTKTPHITMFFLTCIHFMVDI